MKKHKSYGFTVVELIVVIVVIAVLTSITAIAYRSTQADSRDKKRTADAMILKSAVDEYYADNGAYPQPGTCSSGPVGSGLNECWANEVWDILKTNGYLEKVPTPEAKSTYSPGSTNIAPNGNSYYGYYGGLSGAYGIYIPLESGDCKIGQKIVASWWNSVKTCDF